MVNLGENSSAKKQKLQCAPPTITAIHVLH